MSALLALCRFELRYQVKQPIFVILSLVFFAIGFIAMASDVIQVGDGNTALNLNAPFVVIQTQSIFALIGTFAAIAFAPTAITRDRDYRADELIMATPVSRSMLFGARFVGGYVATALVVLSTLLGTLIGTLSPWLDSQRLGPFLIEPYLFATFAITLPVVLVECALTFSLAAVTRSLAGALAAALAMISLYAVVGSQKTPETVKAFSFLDPYGDISLSEVTRYWTVFDKNTLTPAFDGVYAWSRLLWIALALISVAAVVIFHRPRLQARVGKSRKSQDIAAVPNDVGNLTVTASPALSGWRLRCAQWSSQLRVDLGAIVSSPGFGVVVVLGVFNALFGILGTRNDLFGTAVYASTGLVLSVLYGSYFLFLLAVLAYYSGDIVLRERSVRVNEIVDSTTCPPAVLVASKIAAIWFALIVALLAAGATGIATQLFTGYHDIKPLVFMVGLFINIGGTFFLMTPLAVLFSVASANRFVGMGLVLLLFIVVVSLNRWGFQHPLYQVAITPQMVYSDINGWNPDADLLPWLWVYWGAFGAMAAIGAHLLWARGALEPLTQRLRTAATRFHTSRLPAFAALATFVVSGAFIFYNTNVLNAYESPDDAEQIAADYEHAYKKFDSLPTLDITDLDMAVDIFPEDRRVDVRAEATLKNLNATPIRDLYVTVPRRLTIKEYSMPGVRQVSNDTRLGFQHWLFEPAIAPNAEVKLRWQAIWSNPGFVAHDPNTRVISNGTFFDSGDVLPVFAYRRDVELKDPTKRREHNLGPPRRAPLRDQAHRDVAMFLSKTRSTFRAVVSTSLDQTAMAPGYLQREWTAGQRRYFDYQTNEPIWPFASFSSARYEHKRDRWHDVDIEVLYHREHAYNLDSMIASTKASLDYFSVAFSPYQYRQFRILEFPGYRVFAESFPNTIPFSEAIGFTADLTDKQSIDYVYYVTAHEMAHQWWGHQVTPADMQGAAMITESLAQYSALMVMERRFGREKMRRFLRYELDRYLKNRGAEAIDEMPLALVEDQGYIHYGKGSLTLYALKDYLGEARVNAALKRFVQKFAFKGAPFPSTIDLIREFRVGATAEENALITDLFEKIVLFDLKITDAKATPLPNGTYRVEAKAQATKLLSDGKGRTTTQPFTLAMDVGVFAERTADIDARNLPPSLRLQRQTIHDGENSISMLVAKKPGSVGIDPLNVLIDRDPDDNVKSLD